MSSADIHLRVLLVSQVLLVNFVSIPLHIGKCSVRKGKWWCVEFKFVRFLEKYQPIVDERLTFNVCRLLIKQQTFQKIDIFKYVILY